MLRLVRHLSTDVLVVGGGPVGLALASALASSPLKVALVEAGDLSKIYPPHGTYSNRVSSLTNASQAFLQDIGAWAHVDLSRTCPIEEMQVWDGISDARINFTIEMARLTENLNLQRGLLNHLQKLGTVQLLDNLKVVSIDRDDKSWPLVHLSDGRVVRTRLLVGADGPNSPVRAYAGISSFGWSYDTHAIVATMTHPPSQTPNTAYQRFLPTGPIAFLPLSPTTSSLVWSTKPHLAAALKKADPAILVSMINAAFRLPNVSLRYLHNLIEKDITHADLLQEITWREQSHTIDPHSPLASASAPQTTGVVPPPDSDLYPPLITSLQPGTTASFPLRSNHVDSYLGTGAGARTVLVGDAAHTLHPLAGQGLNLGLADVQSLARCISSSVEVGGDIGTHTALLPYTRERYFENHKIMSSVDTLHKLYTHTSDPVVWARSVGLEVLNELDSVKAGIMMTAGAKSRVKGWSALGGVAVGVHALERLVGGLVGRVGNE